MSLLLSVHSVAKHFQERVVFEGISFEVKSPSSLAISGKNGAGKTTLLKILAGVLTPTYGSVTIAVGGNAISREEFYNVIGFVAPYLELYDEFSAEENLLLLSKLRSGVFDKVYAYELLEQFGLLNRKNDLVGTYSSGMKQRLKYVLSLLQRPKLLLVDEPTTNLDEEGNSIVESFIRTYRSDGIVIVATNNRSEVQWCNHEIHLGNVTAHHG